MSLIPYGSAVVANAIGGSFRSGLLVIHRLHGPGVEIESVKNHDARLGAAECAVALHFDPAIFEH
jgi:hypothetical protein